MLAELQGLMEELRKNQAEIAANQEQSDASLHGRISELEQKLEEYNVERQQVQARLCEMEEQNIKREEVEATLRGRITVLEEKLKERDEREEVKATFSGYTRELEREGTDAEAIKELVKKPQESDAHSRQVGFDFNGHFEKLKRMLEEIEVKRKRTYAETSEEEEEDEIFMDELEDPEYFEEPERRERKMESDFEKMYRDENKELENKFERTPRYGAYIIIPFLSVFYKDYTGTRIPWKYFGFLLNFCGFGFTNYYVVDRT